MFDFSRQVKLKQAQNALRDGRLDEAYAIASEAEIRDHRGGQVLLERLVEPLLDRAAGLLAAGHLQEAFRDVERAVAAGGDRPRAVALRAEILKALEGRQRDERRGRELVESARAHIEKGSLRAGLDRLREAPPDRPEVSRLERQAEQRERRIGAAMARAEEQIGRGEIPEALEAAVEAIEAGARREDLAEPLSRLRKAAMAAVEAALDGGRIREAAELSGRLRAAIGSHPDLHAIEEALRHSERAARALQSADYETARIAAGRLRNLRPRAQWVEESLAELERIAGALRSLRTGPLGVLASGHDAGAGDGPQPFAARPTVASPPPRPGAKANGPAGRDAAGRNGAAPPRGERLLLWIDGVGTFLLLSGDRASLGRDGSSTRPDLGLSADISGYHAEIIRDAEDYFIIAAQGRVEVNGKPVQRQLLGDGDRILLGTSCSAVFRLPTALSSSAVLELHRGQRIEGDVREVILMSGHFLIGPDPGCHVRARGTAKPVVISRRQGALICRAQEEITVNGKPAGREAPVPLGAHVQVGDLTFTITASKDGKKIA